MNLNYFKLFDYSESLQSKYINRKRKKLEKSLLDKNFLTY